MLPTYIAVAWLTSCSPQGWVDYFHGSMTLEEAKGSLSVRQCLPVSAGTGYSSSEPGHSFCVENGGKETIYFALRDRHGDFAVEMGPSIHPCTTPTS